jgi:glutathione S-transferase
MFRFAPAYLNALGGVRATARKVDEHLGGTGQRNGLDKNTGHILGGAMPGLADLITATLWTTMTERFSKIHDLFEETAPMTAALTRRISALPPLVELAETAGQNYGQTYAGGQIGASMAKILND